MTPELRTSIIEELRAYLKREPHENEIVNAQNDSRVMGWIRDKEVQLLKQDQTTTNTDVQSARNDIIDLKKRLPK